MCYIAGNNASLSVWSSLAYRRLHPQHIHYYTQAQLEVINVRALSPFNCWWIRTTLCIWKYVAKQKNKLIQNGGICKQNQSIDFIVNGVYIIDGLVNTHFRSEYWALYFHVLSNTYWSYNQLLSYYIYSSAHTLHIQNFVANK